MLTTTLSRRGTDQKAEHGFSLVELLVVILILGILGAGLIRTFVTTAETVAVGVERADSLEDIRPAVQRITRELRVADPIVISTTANYVNELGAVINRGGKTFRHNFVVSDDDLNGEFELTESVVELVTAADGSVDEVPVRSDELVILVDNGTTADPVFSYFDQDGNEIDCSAVDAATCKSQLVNARLITMSVTRQVRDQEPIRLETSIHVRNVEYDQ